MALTFGRIGAAEILQRMGRLKTPKVSTRVFNLGGEKFVAKTGETANGVKWTKLYNQDELVSWKRAALVETIEKFFIHVAQQSSRPQGPVPPIRPAS